VSTDIAAETAIARPRDEVARYVVDWRNDPEWIGGISRGTRVTVRVQGNASGFYRFAGPALSAMVKRSALRDLARLRELLEST
jgi:hypothetical protein